MINTTSLKTIVMKLSSRFENIYVNINKKYQKQSIKYQKQSKKYQKLLSH